MDGLAVRCLDSGDMVFALELEFLHPVHDMTSELVTRDMVALITALEGQSDARIMLQVAGRPEPKQPERGRIDVHVIGVVSASSYATDPDSSMQALSNDLQDLLAMPPLRWSFRPVSDGAELEALIDPVPTGWYAEIARREEPCQPLAWLREAGYRADPESRAERRPLWSTWTLGPTSQDLRRLAQVLLSQSAPVVVRTSLTPTALTDDERRSIEELAVGVESELPQDGLVRASLRTLQSLLFVRPLFEVRCVVASPDPLSRALLSAIGHSMSEPAEHGAGDPVLRGGFAVLRDRDPGASSSLSKSFGRLENPPSSSTLAPESLRRVRHLMGAWEAANVFRLPVADDEVFPGIELFDLPVLTTPVNELATEGTRLGRMVGHLASPVLVDNEERFRHMYVSGQTGTGKSTLLFNLASQDIQSGAGVAVLDPHGDLIEQLLESIPDDRLDDVVLVDPADPVAVVGVNLLEAETAVQREYLVSELCGMFYAMFDPNRQGIVGPRYESMLRAGAGLLLARPDLPSSMLDIPTVFGDDALRTYLLDGLTDPLLLEYWKGEVASRRSNDYGEVMAWFRSKFEVFRMSALVRNVLGQARSTISFSDVLSERRILLVNLSKGMLGEYNSALIGQVVFMRLWAAALERASVPADQRSDFFVYIDEFQNMTTDSLPDVLSEARKFRIGLTLANQFFSQVDESVRDAIMGNVGSKVTFRLGPKDAGLFASWLGNGIASEDLTSLPNHHAVVSLSNRGVPLDSFVMRGEPRQSSGSGTRGAQSREHSRANWARPVDHLDQEFFGRWAGVKGSFANLAAASSQPNAQPAKPSSTSSTTAAQGGSSKSSFLDDWLAKKASPPPAERTSDEDNTGDEGST